MFDDQIPTGYTAYADNYRQRGGQNLGFRVGSPIEMLPALCLVSLSAAIAVGSVVLPLARVVRRTLRGGLGAGLVAFGGWQLRRAARRFVFLELRLWWETDGRSRWRGLTRS